MRGPTQEDVSGGVDLRVTIPVTMGPDEAVHELAPRLSVLAGRRAPASSGEAGTYPGVPVVTIDSYSGSGKFTLAATLARLVNGWQVLHLNDWYLGWGSLAEGAHAARQIVVDLRGGHASPYEAWDWGGGGTGATISVSPAPTIIEGCGVIDTEADLSVWIVDPDEDEWRSRVLVCDGQTYVPYWQRWADQGLGRSLPQVYAAATS